MLVWVAGGIGMWFLAVKDSKTPREALFKGALLGFVGYVLFNFTNYFLLKNYDLKVAYVDTIYGIVVYGLLSYIYKKYLIKMI